MTEQVALPSGMAIGYREWGRADGPVALLLHGLTSDSSSWELVGPRIGERFRCIAPDARGHGDSDWADDYSFAAQRDDVIAVMDALGVLAAAVVGHSMGGATGFLLAATHPERVRALVLEEMPTGLPADPPREVPDGPTPGETTDWRAIRTVFEWRNAGDPTWDEHADRIGCRALVVGGLRSHLPQKQQRRIAKRLSRGRYVALDTTHSVHGERPGEFAAVVQPFFDEAIR